MPAETLTIVLAGDAGESLAPLTDRRVKAAVTFGGEYRVVDFVLSNCLHSGLRRLLVLTGANAFSLHRHLRDGWSVFNPELGEYVTPLPETRRDGAGGGVLEQILEYRHIIERIPAEHVLVVDAGHIYRMDYAALIEQHADRLAELTIAVAPRDTRMRSSRPTVVYEATDGERGAVVSLDTAAGDEERSSGISLGAYVLDRDLLLDALEEHVHDPDSGGDIELDVMARLVARVKSEVYQFGGSSGRVSRDRFFTDLCDIDAYFGANMALLEPVPVLDLYQENWPIWCRAERNPPARTVESRQGNEGLFVNSIVSNGTVIRGSAVSRSVLSPRVRVEDSATIERSVLFHGVHVGEGAALRNCVVDKHARISPGDRIGFDPKGDAGRFHISTGGIVVVPAGYAGETG